VQKILTVYQVNNYIKSLLDNDVVLSGVMVQGEISNFKNHSSGHLYFTLKDDNAVINCVMFKNHTNNLRFAPQNGLGVFIYGRVGLYEKTGAYQIYAEIIEPAGKGALHLAFEQLKDKLAGEGLFDRKRELPKHPKNVLLITSPTGAVVQDMIQITKRRNPSVNLLILPVLVQGDEAPASIAEALYDANGLKDIDLIILARGGGSVEDLWCFNNEKVARAIFNCKHVVISAVGHETDFTIADFAADLRASTPSAAIEIAITEQENLQEKIKNQLATIGSLLDMRLSKDRGRLKTAISNRSFKEPLEMVYNKQILMANYKKDLNANITTRFELEKTKAKFLISSLNNLSPTNVLARGYSMVSNSDGLVKHADYIKNDDEILIKFRDSKVILKVERRD